MIKKDSISKVEFYPNIKNNYKKYDKIEMETKKRITKEEIFGKPASIDNWSIKFRKPYDTVTIDNLKTIYEVDIIEYVLTNKGCKERVLYSLSMSILDILNRLAFKKINYIEFIKIKYDKNDISTAHMYIEGILDYILNLESINTLQNILIRPELNIKMATVFFRANQEILLDGHENLKHKTLLGIKPELIPNKDDENTDKPFFGMKNVFRNEHALAFGKYE